jgi:hypothetical protein
MTKDDTIYHLKLALTEVLLWKYVEEVQGPPYRVPNTIRDGRFSWSNARDKSGAYRTIKKALEKAARSDAVAVTRDDVIRNLKSALTEVMLLKYVEEVKGPPYRVPNTIQGDLFFHSLAPDKAIAHKIIIDAVERAARTD